MGRCNCRASSPTAKVELVNQTAVEEVLLDIGMLDFGKGVEAKANTSVWRTRGDEKQLVGEFVNQHAELLCWL